MSDSTSTVNMTVYELAKEVDEIRSEWNGDEAGEQERQALIADEIFKQLAHINALYKELHND